MNKLRKIIFKFRLNGYYWIGTGKIAIKIILTQLPAALLVLSNSLFIVSSLFSVTTIIIFATATLSPTFFFRYYKSDYENDERLFGNWIRYASGVYELIDEETITRIFVFGPESYKCIIINKEYCLSLGNPFRFAHEEEIKENKLEEIVAKKYLIDDMPTV